MGFTTPLFEGLWGLTLSPAKSVFIFAPVALLLGPALWQLRRSGSGATLFLTANLMTTLLIAATWTAWEGGWAWGPRLLLPGLVPAIAALAPWMGHASWRRGAVVAVLIAGFVVSLPTVFVPTRAQQLDGNNFAPEIVRQAELIRPTVSKSIRSLGGVGPLERRKVVPLWHILSDDVSEIRLCSQPSQCPVCSSSPSCWASARPGSVSPACHERSAEPRAQAPVDEEPRAARSG